MNKFLDKKDKQIEITEKENKNNIILSIKDNGVDISESNLYRVFEKGFTRGNRKKKVQPAWDYILPKNFLIN